MSSPGFGRAGLSGPTDCRVRVAVVGCADRIDHGSEQPGSDCGQDGGGETFDRLGGATVTRSFGRSLDTGRFVVGNRQAISADNVGRDQLAAVCNGGHHPDDLDRVAVKSPWPIEGSSAWQVDAVFGNGARQGKLSRGLLGRSIPVGCPNPNRQAQSAIGRPTEASCMMEEVDVAALAQSVGERHVSVPHAMLPEVGTSKPIGRTQVSLAVHRLTGAD